MTSYIKFENHFNFEKLFSIVISKKKCYFIIVASHHIGHRQHSPGVQNVRNSSLRVVIPGSMNNSGLQANDEITYNEVK